jgi:hypothetical protein
MIGSPDINLKKVFAARAAAPVTSGTSRKTLTLPLSIRVTEDEKAQLQALATFRRGSLIRRPAAPSSVTRAAR